MYATGQFIKPKTLVECDQICKYMVDQRGYVIFPGSRGTTRLQMVASMTVDGFRNVGTN